MAKTFHVRFGRSVFARTGFLAGDAAGRRADLEVALTCPETRLVVCARGGVGCAELLGPTVAGGWSNLGPTPFKWLIGFSDVTALHTQWQAHGLPSIHASNVTSLGVGCANVRERWLAHVLDPWRPQRWQLQTLVPGSARGRLIGGNLSVLHDLCASGQWQPQPGSLLFLEEIAEAPYRIHRMLSALHRGGHLRHITGLVIGQVTASHVGIHGVSARQVFATLCTEWQLPCAWGLPSGHELGENHPLTLGCHATLQATGNGTTFDCGPSH